ncbi:MAG: hypothetical protein R3362_00640, partial [Rhodothermales bacterium]|nr:hypothetical protein [Rhodothermales bacterium]
PEPAPPPRAEGPGLVAALLPIVLPVVLIAANTVVAALARAEVPGAWAAIAPYAAVVGNPNLALLFAAAAALGVYHVQRRPSRPEAAEMIEAALMSAGVIILITAAGGAFGATLRAAEIGPALADLFPAEAGGFGLLFLAFGVASLIKVAQGSSTVAMITAAGIVGGLVTGAGPLAFHPVYLATAIASGSLVGSWMNDSGFWLYTRMGGLTEVEALKSWTPLLALLGVTGMGTTLVLALVLPLS